MSARTEPISPREPTRAGRQPRLAWFVLAVLLAFSIAAPLNQFKVPPILPVLMDAFRLSIGGAGSLMSVYAVTGLILALPAGLILRRLGYRLTGLIAGASIVLGALLGATSSDMSILLASRVIEGIGTSFMAVLAPAIIALWFVASKRGAAMGIWATWVPVGATAMLILAPLLSHGADWRAVWWFGSLYALAVTVLYLVFVRHRPGDPAAGNSSFTAPAVSAMHVLRNREVWLISLAFGCFNMAGIGINSFLPTYLNQVHGMSLSQAALIASLASVISIFAGPAGGILSDRIGSRKRPYLWGMLLMGLSMPLFAVVGSGALVVLVLFQGLVGSLVPTNIFSAGVEVVGDERLGGLAMGVIMVGQNAGMLAGPLLFGALIEASGWPLAFASQALVCAAGALAGWLARTR